MAKKLSRKKTRRQRQPARRRRAASKRKPTRRRTARALRRRTRKAAPRRKLRTRRRVARRPAPRRPPGRTTRPAPLERARRQLSDVERAEAALPLPDLRLISSARAGHDELKAAIGRHTETSPELTAGDVDAKWEDAYAIGDEAPGGDNPTPGQDRVDDIGKALGIQYRDDEELRGGDEIAERDHHRWELDPKSKDRNMP